MEFTFSIVIQYGKVYGIVLLGVLTLIVHVPQRALVDVLTKPDKGGNSAVLVGASVCVNEPITGISTTVICISAWTKIMCSGLNPV